MSEPKTDPTTLRLACAGCGTRTEGLWRYGEPPRLVLPICLECIERVTGVPVIGALSDSVKGGPK